MFMAMNNNERDAKCCVTNRREKLAVAFSDWLISFLPVRLDFLFVEWGSILSGGANGSACPGGSTVGVQSWFKAGWARAVCAQQLINLPSACLAAAIPAHA